MIDVEFIKSVAKEKKISLAELAERIGYSEAGFHRACSNAKFKIDALQKISLVLEITPERFIKNETTLRLVQAMGSTRIESTRQFDWDILHQLIESERAFLHDTIMHTRKQLEVKDSQIEHLMNQLELKDGLIRSVMNFYKGMGANMSDDESNDQSVAKK